MVSHRFIIKRLLLLIPVLLGVGTFVFAILHLSPGDPARVILGQRASQARVLELRESMGLNDPLWIQYLRFLSDTVQLDLGQSYKVAQGQSVTSVVATRLPVTIELAVYGQLIGILIGIPLGIISAVKQDSFIDHIGRIGALSGISVPIYWSGPMLILVFSVYFGIFPASGRIGSTVFLPEHWYLFGYELPLTGMVTVDTLLVGDLQAWLSAVRHLFLPAATIGIYSLALISRMMRSSMLEVVRQDYMRTARAKGQGSRITILKHGLQNALIPVITVVGIQFGTLLGGAVLTETVFGIGGVGTTLVEAISTPDYPLVQGTVLVFALLFTLVNLGVDITYSYLDPRIDQ